MSAPDEIDIVQELGSQPIKRSEGVDEDVNILSQKKKVSNLLTSPVSICFKVHINLLNKSSFLIV